MTTITFENDIKIKKSKFKDIDDFRNYIEDNFYVVELKKVSKSEIPPKIMGKMKETKKLKSPALSIFEMQIKNILERDDILTVLEKKNLLIKYKKAKNFLLGNHSELVDLKKRKPQKDEVWQFRIDKQFRAYCYFEKDILIVFHIDNHQN